MPARPRKSQEEWKSIKNDFFECYIVKKNTLKDTIAYIERNHNGFTATEKEYRRRLDEWGLRKNLPKGRSHDIVRGNINGDLIRRRIRLSPKTAKRRLARNTGENDIVLKQEHRSTEIPWFYFEERNLGYLRGLVGTIITQLPWVNSLETPAHPFLPAEFSLHSASALLGTFFQITDDCESHDVSLQVIQHLRSFMPWKPNTDSDHISVSPFFLLIHSCIYLVSNALMEDKMMDAFLHWVHEIGAVSRLNDIIDELINRLQKNANATTEIFLYQLLRSAVSLQSESLVRKLLKKGVSPDQEQIASVMDQDYSDGPGCKWATPLQMAVIRSNLHICQLLLDYKANVNATACDPSMTPLFLAVSINHGHFEIASTLITSGSDVNCWSGAELMGLEDNAPYEALAPGRTVLMEAVDQQNLEIAELLLNKGADVHGLSTIRGSAIQIAVRRGDIKMVRLLLDYGAYLDPMEAVEDSVVDSVSRCIEKFGYEYTDAEFSGALLWKYRYRYAIKAPAVLMPLQIAAFQEDRNMAKFLLSVGAQANRRGISCDRVWNRVLGLPSVQNDPQLKCKLENTFKGRLTVWHQASKSALQAAVENGSVEITKSLLASGAIVDDIDASGTTPLQVACGLRQLQVRFEGESDEDEWDDGEANEDESALVNLLLEKGADINFPAGSIHGRTALQAAAQSGNEHLVTFLLSQGANVNAPAGPNDGITALQAAALTGRSGLVTKIIEAGATSNQDIYHITLDSAASKGFESDVDDLLTIDLDTTIKRTALSSAIAGQHPHIVRRLLDHQVDPNDLDKGETALCTAVKADNPEILEMLLKEGADPNIRDVTVTPLALAASIVSLTMVQVLLKAKADVNQLSCKPLACGHTRKVNALCWALSSWVEKCHTIPSSIRFQIPDASGIVSLLLEHGADPNEANGLLKYPLELVSELLAGDLVTILLDKNADVDAPCSQPHLGWAFAYWNSSQDIGATKESEEITRKIINASKRPLDETILIGLMVKNKYFSWAGELLARGLNVKSCESKTALAWACRHGQIDLVEKLLDQGACLLGSVSMEAHEIEGISAFYLVTDVPPRRVSFLEIATQNAHFNLVKLLLDRGAKDIINARVFTALNLAANKGLLDIAFLLLQYDDEPHTLKSRCIVAAELAAAEGHRILAQNLRRYIS